MQVMVAKIFLKRYNILTKYQRRLIEINPSILLLQRDLLPFLYRVHFSGEHA